MRIWLLAWIWLLPFLAEAQWVAEAGTETGGGYDSNIYLDAAALPAEIGASRGPFFYLAPSFEGDWGRRSAHHLRLNYDADFRQIMLESGGGESRFLQGLDLNYLSAPIADFNLTITAGFYQLYLGHLSEGGWMGGKVAAEIARPLTHALRFSVMYQFDYMDYKTSDLSVGITAEVSHQLRVALPWHVAPGVMIEPSYSLFLMRPDAEYLNSTRHRGGLALFWNPLSLPLAASVSYNLTNLAIGEYISGQQPVVTFAERVDYIHQIRGEIRWCPLHWLYLFARYDGTLGRSTAIADYSQHVGLVGLAVRGEWSSSRSVTSSPSRARPKGLFNLEVEAPGAQAVSVIGTFNQWNPNQDRLQRHGNLWSISLTLPPGKYTYLIWVDGIIKPPPQCEVLIPDGFGSQSCLLLLE